MDQTKASFKTTEFWAMVGVITAILVASAVSDSLGDVRAWTLVAAVAIGYMISRGLAKAGTRYTGGEDLSAAAILFVARIAEQREAGAGPLEPGPGGESQEPANREERNQMAIKEPLPEQLQDEKPVESPANPQPDDTEQTRRTRDQHEAPGTGCKKHGGPHGRRHHEEAARRPQACLRKAGSQNHGNRRATKAGIEKSRRQGTSSRERDATSTDPGIRRSGLPRTGRAPIRRPRVALRRPRSRRRTPTGWQRLRGRGGS